MIQGVTQTIQNERREQIGGFLSILLGTSGASLLGSMVAGKGFIWADNGFIQVGEGITSQKQKQDF